MKTIKDMNKMSLNRHWNLGHLYYQTSTMPAALLRNEMTMIKIKSVCAGTNGSYGKSFNHCAIEAPSEACLTDDMIKGKLLFDMLIFFRFFRSFFL